MHFDPIRHALSEVRLDSSSSNIIGNSPNRSPIENYIGDGMPSFRTIG